MRGFWADERVDGGLWNLSNPIFNYIYKFFKRKEIEFFSQSDSVISLTENGKSEIHSWESVPNNPIPIEVIPCCVDAEFFDYTKIDQNSIRALKTKIHINKESYILSYLGSIGTWYLLEEMLDFFIVLKKSIPSAIFLFITQDDKKKILGVSRAKGISDEDIFIIKAQRNEVPLLASLSNSSIFFIKPSYSKKASSPTKQGELMALGIPIICNDGVGDTSSIVKKYESGIVIDAFNINNYEKAIEDLVSMKFEKAKIRAGAMDYFSLEKGVEKYANVYSKIFQY